MESFADRLSQANAALAPYAVPHQGVLGREHAEQPDATRFAFQRDRDRIIHTAAYRRLKGKTQVFVTGDGDHYRTRLTHTQEVSQVARDIARTLGLNEDLCECIALAHDLGHPPFGHGGEAAINAWLQTHDERFEHNMQSHRIVTLLESRCDQYAGLNLNREVLEGMLKHVTPHDRPDHAAALPEGAGHTLEAQVVNIADEIAYTCHDCDDGLHEGLFTIDDVCTVALGRQAADHRTHGAALRGALVDLLVTDLYAASARRIALAAPETLQDVRKQPAPLIGFSEGMRRSMDELRAFLWKHMYFHPRVAQRVTSGQRLVTELCQYLFAHPSPKILSLQQQTGASLAIAVKDYVAGMTDTFAADMAKELGLSVH